MYDGSTSVASCAHQAIHQASAALADEGHHTAGQTARLLAPDGKDDQHSLGCRTHTQGKGAQHISKLAIEVQEVMKASLAGASAIYSECAQVQLLSKCHTTRACSSRSQRPHMIQS